MFFSAVTNAQDLQFEEIENAPSFEDIEIIETLTEQREQVEKSRTRVLAPPPLPARESRPPPYRAVLPEGTILTKISDNKDFATAKRIQVWAQEIYPGSQTTHILGKDKEPLYSARSLKVVPIESDLALTPDIDPRITYDRAARARFRAYEKTLNTVNDFAIELETITPNYWNQIFAQDLENATANRFTLKSFYDGDLIPVDFGFSISYQTASAASDDFEMEWSSLFLGPQISYKVWQSDLWQFDIEAGASAALISNVRTTLTTYSPSNYEWGGAMKFTRMTWLGEVFGMVEYRRSIISLNEVTAETSQTTDSENQSSLAFGIGYRLRLGL